MFSLKTADIVQSLKDLDSIPEGKVLINTINAHSYNVAQKDSLFAEALLGGDYLIPDGSSIVGACRFLKAASRPAERISGWDLFIHEMDRVASGGGKVMFAGSSQEVLSLIRERVANEYPDATVVTYSPPYKPSFSEADDKAMIAAINAADPDLLWIGMTAPKQEKWAYSHWNELDIRCHCGTVGAVFDFYAGTVRRAPLWWQKNSLEWLYRLIREPRRMWKRYLVGNVLFIVNILKEKLS